MILSILSIIAGIAFTAAGVYFLTPGYLNKLNTATSELSPEKVAKNKLRAKACGYIGLGIGALTVVFGIFLFIFPELSSVLVLIYMVTLLISCVVLMAVYK